MEIREVEIPVGWGTLRGLVGGKGTEAVLCLHGIQANAATFYPLLTRLLRACPRHTFLALDLPGHGRSDYYPLFHSFDVFNLMMDISKIYSHFGWSRATLVGHSYGAWISSAFAGYFPSYISKLVLLDPVMTYPAQDPEQFYDKQMIALHNNLYYQQVLRHKKNQIFKTEEELRSKVENKSFFKMSKENTELIFSRQIVKNNSDYIFRKFDGRVTSGEWTRSPFLADVEKVALSQIRSETLVIRATDPNVMSISNYEDTLRILLGGHPLSRDITVQGSHVFHMEFPDHLSQILTTFLGELPKNKL